VATLLVTATWMASLYGRSGEPTAAVGFTALFSVFYIVAPETMVDTPSLELKERHYPGVEVRGDLSGNRGFFDCRKAEELLGWTHET
jgi:hypothetical protein